MEVFDGYQYCLYIIYTTIPNPYSMYPRMIIYIDVYIHIFLFVVFMDITGAFVVVSVFPKGIELEIMSSHTLKSCPTGVIGMILWVLVFTIHEMIQLNSHFYP